MIRPLLAGMLFAGTIACAGSAAAEAPQVSDPDEQRLWRRADEETLKLDDSKAIYRNPNMERYLDSLAARLAAATPAPVPIRVMIIRNRTCNAFIYPNGRMYIHTGLIAAMQNEDQLATIMGHEIVHAVNRHMLKEVRDARDKTAISAVMGALTGNVLLPLGNLGAMASIMGYSREMESEADREGLHLMVRSGYDPREALNAFQLLQQEAIEEPTEQSFFFASHPKLQERIDSYTALLKTVAGPPASGVRQPDRYLAIFGPLLLDSAEMDLKAGRNEHARATLNRYTTSLGDHARACLLLGESYRLSGNPADTAAARQQYQKAISMNPEYAAAHRLLGLLAYKQKDADQARVSLSRYLQLESAAPDRIYIESILHEIQERR